MIAVTRYAGKRNSNSTIKDDLIKFYDILRRLRYRITLYPQKEGLIGLIKSHILMLQGEIDVVHEEWALKHACYFLQEILNGASCHVTVAHNSSFDQSKYDKY